MEKKTIEKFTHFLKKSGIRKLFEGYMNTYNYGRKFDEYCESLDDPILAVAHAFEFDRIPTTVNFKTVSARWESIVITNRLDAKVNAVIDAHGLPATYRAIQEQKDKDVWFLVSPTKAEELKKTHEEEEERKVFKAHLVSVKPKKEFAPGGNDDFEFIKFTKKVPNSTDEHHIIVRKSNKNNYIKFNEHITLLCKENELYQMRVRLDRTTGDIHFIFQEEETEDSIKCVFKNGTSLYLNSKPLIEWLASKLNLNEEMNLVCVTKNLSKTDEFITIKINQ